ncbi:flavin reductase family protein [Clostridium sp. DJ247]|uniref:flavin reductase family protein n=1 Tax=Clostridium sp. DJ247 TaxID=2726188 RepID=UPI0016267934|nr:flavin reductase family protein [Clostridium sp. DJ247]MBC2579047.1 flavin reductase family protein [Clostridium sp. DJ247]
MEFTENLGKHMEYLHKQGAFLTTKVGDETNTMTISWGSIGFIWQKPVFTVLVRESRYTHNLIEKAGEFTVSIPVDDSLKKALATCGTKSGRDINKISECNLELVAGKNIETPVIKGCGVHYECKIVYKENMNPKFLNDEINKKCYGDNDYHTVYYGEIVNCYTDEE